jgi:hypothetical protein
MSSRRRDSATPLLPIAQGVADAALLPFFSIQIVLEGTMEALSAVAGTLAPAVLLTSYRPARNGMKKEADTIEKDVKSVIESEEE